MDGFKAKLVDSYNEGNDLIEDYLFDNIFNPDDSYKDAIKLNPSRKVKIPYYCGSLDKKLTDKSINKWYQDYNSVICSPKYDGISLIVDSNKAYTRGNGTTGLDVTDHYIIMGYNFPPEGTILRGEVICLKSIYNKYREDYKGPRQLVSATFNTIIPNQAILEELIFIVFWIVGDTNPISSQLEFLTNSGFDHANYFYLTDEMMSVSSLTEILLSEEENDYPIDGLVITYSGELDEVKDGNPPWAFAFKREKESIQTTVTDIEWTLSRRNKLIPVICFEPIIIENSKITRCTGHNAQIIEALGIGKGAIIKVGMGNDIIPKLFDVISKVDPILPDNTIWDDNHTHLLMVEDNETSQAKMLVYQLRAIGIVGVGEKTCLKAISQGYCDILDFINDDVKYSKFLSSSNIIEHLKEWTLLQSLKASTFFINCSDTMLSKILNIFDNDLKMITDYDITEESVYNTIINSDGFGDKRASIITEAIFKYNEWMQKINYPTVADDNVTSNLYRGKSFCMSGTRDNDLKNAILTNGGIVKESVTKKLDILLVKSNEEITTKVKKAQSYGTKIMTIDDFYKSLN